MIVLPSEKVRDQVNVIGLPMFKIIEDPIGVKQKKKKHSMVDHSIRTAMSHGGSTEFFNILNKESI